MDSGVASLQHYKETEARLKRYAIIKERIADIDEMLLDVCNVHASSFNDAVTCSTSTFRDTSVESEVLKREKLEAKKREYNREIKIIESALKRVKEDTYFCIIEKFYFRRRSATSIAVQLCCDVATVNRNKRRLVKMINEYLYPDDSSLLPRGIDAV